jgi:single-strand DNA-binding protein
MSQRGINKLIVLGHVGADADLKFTAAGKPVANFSVAVNESFKNSKGDNIDRVEWFQCVAWNGLAEVCGQYLTRGAQVYIEGRLQTRKYDDKDGAARTSTEVVVRTLRLLSGPRDGSKHGETVREEQLSATGNGSPEDTEDIPS